MATLLQQSLPVDSVAITATGLAGLASNANRIGGYALPAVSNRGNLDITHLLSGTIRAGTSPTVGTYLDVWMIPAKSYASGVPVWPAGLTGAAGAVSFASMGVLQRGGGVAQVVQHRDLGTSNFDWEFHATRSRRVQRFDVAV